VDPTTDHNHGYFVVPIIQAT
jgi:hypothetical protein